jgi:hypothetical protein
MRAGEIDFGISENLDDLLRDAIDRPEPAAAFAPSDEIFFRRGKRRSRPEKGH